jgi:Phage minor capsid protein 2
MVSDTMEDLLGMTDKMEVRVKKALRRAVGEQLRAKAAANEGRRSMAADVIKSIRKELEAAGSVGIIDRAGRRWKVEDYAETVVRTKIQQAHIEGVKNEALERGAYYGQISSHGAKDACRYHEGRIVKLDSRAPGNYPTLDSLKGSGQIFHPRCRHTVYPLRDPGLLPASEQERAERQARIGEAAAASGKRNPNPEEVRIAAGV